MAQHQRLWGLWITGYRRDMWFWEGVIFMRKLFCTVAVLLDFRPHQRAFALTSIATLSLLMHFSYRPYDKRCFDLLDNVEVAQLAIWSFCCMGLELIAMRATLAALIVWLIVLLCHSSYILWILHMLGVHHLTELAWSRRNDPSVKQTGNPCWHWIVTYLLASHKLSLANLPYVAFDPFYGWISTCGTGADAAISPHVPRGKDAVDCANSFDGRVPPSHSDSVLADFFTSKDTEKVENRTVLVRGFPANGVGKSEVRDFMEQHAVHKNDSPVIVVDVILALDYMKVLKEKWNHQEIHDSELSALRSRMHDVALMLVKDPWRAADLAFSQVSIHQQMHLVVAGAAVVVFKEKWMVDCCIRKWCGLYQDILYRERHGLFVGPPLQRWQGQRHGVQHRVDMSRLRSNWAVFGTDERVAQGQVAKPNTQVRRRTLELLSNTWVPAFTGKLALHSMSPWFMDFLIRAAFSLSYDGGDEINKEKDQPVEIDERTWAKATQVKDPVMLLGDLTLRAREEHEGEDGEDQDDSLSMLYKKALEMEEQLQLNHAESETLRLKSEGSNMPKVRWLKERKPTERPANSKQLGGQPYLLETGQAPMDAEFKAQLAEQAHRIKLREFREARLRGQVCTMFNPAAYRVGMTQQELQFNLMALELVPTEELMEWLDIFEERASFEVSWMYKHARAVAHGARSHGVQTDDIINVHARMDEIMDRDINIAVSSLHGDAFTQKLHPNRQLGHGVAVNNWLRLGLHVLWSQEGTTLRPIVDVAHSLRNCEVKVSSALDRIMEIERVRLREETGHVDNLNETIDVLCTKVEAELELLGFNREDHDRLASEVPAYDETTTLPTAAKTQPHIGDLPRKLSGPRFLAQTAVADLAEPLPPLLPLPEGTHTCEQAEEVIEPPPLLPGEDASSMSPEAEAPEVPNAPWASDPSVAPDSSMPASGAVALQPTSARSRLMSVLTPRGTPVDRDLSQYRPAKLISTPRGARIAKTATGPRAVTPRSARKSLLKWVQAPSGGAIPPPAEVLPAEVPFEEAVPCATVPAPAVQTAKEAVGKQSRPLAAGSSQSTVLAAESALPPSDTSVIPERR